MIQAERIKPRKKAPSQGAPPFPPDFRALFEAVPDPCLVLDRELCIVAASDSYLRTTATSREDIVGRRIFEVFPENPEDPASTATADLATSLKRVFIHGIPDSMAVQRYDLPAPGGEGFQERYWNAINAPVFGSDGKVGYVIHRVQDVTEFVHLKREMTREAEDHPKSGKGSARAEAETYAVSRALSEANKELKRIVEALHESQRLFDSFMANLPVAAWVKDREGRYVFANAEVERLFSTKVATLMGRTGEEIFSPAVAAQFRETDRRILEEGVGAVPFEVVREAGGAERYLMVTKFPIPGPAGKPRFVAGLAFDVTRTKLMEAERERLLLQLEAVLDNINEGVVISDLQGRLVTMNREALRLHECQTVEEVRRHMSEFQERFTLHDLHGASLSLDDWPLARALRGERFSDYEVRVFNNDSGKEWIGSYSGTPVADREGNHILAVVTLKDVTGRKEMEEQVRKLNRDLAARVSELEDANQELEAFNRMVSHDLRQPLNTIGTSCQAVEMLCGGNMSDDCKKYLRIAYDRVVAMNGQIGSLLTFSRSGHKEVARRRVDLSDIAGKVAEDVRVADPSRQVKFMIADGAMAYGDPDLLRSVLENLIGNAWKYTGKREQAVIEFGTTEIDGDLAYFVRDNGNGFDMAEAADIFTPFKRLKGAEKFAGFGIGLATVERIIRRHGGKVWAEGEPGKGAVFYFALPSEAAAS